ncbi:Class I glutamine amidotransferase-like protein [Madurella fahalii]|uniref:Class I glutamine amidotransferase-like protein n=1 Tax=Madurella fahalii TaxID=1157608 RepID=A0ABQ0G3J6_9PEZI
MSTPTISTTPKKLRIGVMLEEVQLADIVGIDIFGNLSTPYVSGVIEIDAQYTKFGPSALDIEFFYIATTLETSFMTPPQSSGGSSLPKSATTIAGFKFVPNTTYDTCPRDLDIILIGGPVPTHRPPQADKFMKEAWKKTRVWMTTCIGTLWLASTGLLEGKTCTTNKEFLYMAKEMYPGTNWVRQRWVVEEKEFDGAGKGRPEDGRKGELWTAGGAGTGIDMIAHYCLQNFGHEFVNTMSLEMLELNPGGRRGQFYD